MLRWRFPQLQRLRWTIFFRILCSLSGQDEPLWDNCENSEQNETPSGPVLATTEQEGTSELLIPKRRSRKLQRDVTRQKTQTMSNQTVCALLCESGESEATLDQKPSYTHSSSKIVAFFLCHKYLCDHSVPV